MGISSVENATTHQNSFIVENESYQGVCVRHFIRHPFSIPITYHIDTEKHPLHEERRESHQEDLKDISRGGLSFQTRDYVEEGSEITIVIPVWDPPFEAVGTVKWCKEQDNNFAVGVQFDNATIDFSLRMVEQICYVEEYRQKVLANEGRRLSSNEAAREWIEKYSEDFPEI